MSAPNPPSGEQTAWETEEGVLCVVCPDCAFTFDAIHEDMKGGHSCPACAEVALQSDLRIVRAAMRDFVEWFDSRFPKGGKNLPGVTLHSIAEAHRTALQQLEAGQEQET